MPAFLFGTRGAKRKALQKRNAVRGCVARGCAPPTPCARFFKKLGKTRDIAAKSPYLFTFHS